VIAVIAKTGKLFFCVMKHFYVGCFYDLGFATHKKSARQDLLGG